MATNIKYFNGHGSSFSFGPFRLLPTQRLLTKDKKPIQVGSRAFDILIILLQHAGELVTKEELMARVWPNTFVEPAMDAPATAILSIFRVAVIALSRRLLLTPMHHFQNQAPSRRNERTIYRRISCVRSGVVTLSISSLRKQQESVCLLLSDLVVSASRPSGARLQNV
jgi:Transcriptional regulatory protein, C terminal